MTRAKTALWFAKSFGLGVESTTMKEVTLLEIEDILAAKHVHKRQNTEFTYGSCIRLSMGKF